MLNGSTKEVTEARLFANSRKHAFLQSFQTHAQVSILHKVSIHRIYHVDEQMIWGINIVMAESATHKQQGKR